MTKKADLFRLRLLRARGDRPVHVHRQAGAAQAAPRTRRSTLREREAQMRAAGCSAHAEIDPSRRSWS